MTKPGPKTNGDHSKQQQEETDKTLWHLAQQGDPKAIAAIAAKTGKNGS